MGFYEVYVRVPTPFATTSNENVSPKILYVKIMECSISDDTIVFYSPDTRVFQFILSRKDIVFAKIADRPIDDDKYVVEVYAYYTRIESLNNKMLVSVDPTDSESKGFLFNSRVKPATENFKNK